MEDITLIVKPTHKCNLKCPYCYEEKNRYGINAIMTLEMVEQICRVFKGQLREWIWHGGEPLMMGVDFLRKATITVRQHFPGIKIGIQTNGTLINNEFARFFKNYDVRPGLSFDGINNDRTRCNTARLVEAFRILDQHLIPYGAIMLVSTHNMQNLIAEYEYAKRLGLKQQVNLEFGVKTNSNAVNAESDQLIWHVCEFFDYWMHDTFKPERSQLLENYMGLLLGNGRRFCSEGYCVGRWMSVHADGKIFPCGRDWPDEMCYGNLNDYLNAGEIIESDTFKRFDSLCRGVTEQCEKSGCEFFYACNVGCFGTIYNRTELRGIDQIHCHSIKKIFTHMYNRIKEVDIDKDRDNLNPFFMRALERK